MVRLTPGCTPNWHQDSSFPVEHDFLQHRLLDPFVKGESDQPSDRVTNKQTRLTKGQDDEFHL